MSDQALRTTIIVLLSSLAGLGSGCTTPSPTTMEEPPPPDPDQLLLDHFDQGHAQWVDWHDSPGWIRTEAGDLVIETATADHNEPAFDGDETFTFGALAAHCPAVDADGRCTDPGDGWSDYTFDVDVELQRQLRDSTDGLNLPSSWEVPWVFFRFQDTRHYYYLLFLTHHLKDPASDFGGFEIGKYNCPDDCGVFTVDSGKETLLQVTADDIDDPERRYLEANRRYRFRIQVANVMTEAGAEAVDIQAFMDGELMGGIVDDGTLEPVFGGSGPTPPLFTGGVGLYGEDCEARFDDVSVRRLDAPDLPQP